MDWLAGFKQKKLQNTSFHNISKQVFNILIAQDNYGYYIELVDYKFNPVIISSNSVKLSLRTFTEQFNNAFNIISKTINWDFDDAEEKDNKVYLSDFPQLLKAIPSPIPEDIQIVDRNNKSILFAQNTVDVYFNISNTDSEQLLTSQLIAQTDKSKIENFHFLTNEFIIANQKIYQLSSSFHSADYLRQLESSFPKDQIEFYLSMLATYATTDLIQYESYQMTFKTEPVVSEMAMVIERIDQEKNLFIRLTQLLPGIQQTALASEYELNYVANLNEQDKVIVIRPIQKYSEDVIYETFFAHLKGVFKRKEMAKIVITYPDEVILEKELAQQFLSEALLDLVQDFEILGKEKLKDYKIEIKQPKINVNLSPGIDYFEGEVTLEFDDFKIDLFKAIEQYKKNKLILLSDGRNALVAESYIKRLERMFSKKGKQAQISIFDLPLMEDLLKGQIDEAVFNKYRELYEGFNKIKPIRNVKEVKATLRPYQKYGVAWMQYLMNNNLNGCLADDMGLGKTLQTLCLLQKNKSNLPSLIVMPTTLLFNWQSEIKKFTPDLSFSVYHGTERNLEDAKSKHLILTTYGVVRNDIEELMEMNFHYIILDESQNIKNLNAKSTKAIMLLKSEHRLALSGTPLENNMGELYSLFRFLNPAMFGTFKKFNEKYINPIQRFDDEDVITELRTKIYPFILRRMKNDVLKDLPEKIDNVLYVDMSEQQKKLYEQRRQFYKLAVSDLIQKEGVNNIQLFVFQAFSELRQIASIPEAKSNGAIISPKLELLKDHMLQSIKNGHKVLVFANYLTAVDLITQVLEKNEIHHVKMTGSTNNRQALVKEFKKNKDCKAFVMTLKTGGTGLNLTEADIVYIFDPWWNVAAETQAIDRAHRIGQKNTVISYRLISRNTIEEKIIELQEKKRALFDSLISADTKANKKLSENDIEFILS